MSDISRVELKGALEGHWIDVDEDKLTVGVLEDWESPSVVRTRQALEAIIADSNLPQGHDSAGLKALTRRQVRALVEGVNGYIQVPKS